MGCVVGERVVMVFEKVSFVEKRDLPVACIWVDKVLK